MLAASSIVAGHNPQVLRTYDDRNMTVHGRISVFDTKAEMKEYLQLADFKNQA